MYLACAFRTYSGLLTWILLMLIAALHVLLYGLLSQITLSSWWPAQVAWRPARSWTFSFPKTSRYGRALLQNAKGLFCDSSIGACQKLQTAFLLPVTPQVLSGLLDHTSGPSGKTAWTAAWTYYWRALSCSSTHSKLVKFGIRARLTYLSEERSISNIQIGPWMCFFLGGGRGEL